MPKFTLTDVRLRPGSGLTPDGRARAAQLGITLTPIQGWAFDFLEAHGHTFCADFGVDNAVAHAEALMRQWYRLPDRSH